MRFVPADNREFEPASHEDPRHPGVLKRVIAVKDQLLDGRVQMINWARLPIESSFRAHYHEDMQEVFMLLSGRAAMTVDGKVVTMEPGDTVVVSPREVHSMKNVGDQIVQYIVMGISLGQNGQTIVVDGGMALNYFDKDIINKVVR